MSQGVADEFTDWMRVDGSGLISRTRRMQLRWIRDGKCKQCGQPAAPSHRAGKKLSQFCLKHLVANREYLRGYANRMRRNLGAFSYQLEEEQ